jgi:hypothetical protein
LFNSSIPVLTKLFLFPSESNKFKKISQNFDKNLQVSKACRKNGFFDNRKFRKFSTLAVSDYNKNINNTINNLNP